MESVERSMMETECVVIPWAGVELGEGRRRGGGGEEEGGRSRIVGKKGSGEKSGRAKREATIRDCGFRARAQLGPLACWDEHGSGRTASREGIRPNSTIHLQQVVYREKNLVHEGVASHALDGDDGVSKTREGSRQRPAKQKKKERKPPWHCSYSNWNVITNPLLPASATNPSSSVPRPGVPKSQ